MNSWQNESVVSASSSGRTKPAHTTLREPISSEWVLISDALGSPILFANQIARPETVPVGGVVDVVIGMTNRAQAILDFWSDDVCNSGESLTAGYQYEIQIDPSWRRGEVFTNCLGIGEFGSNTTTHQRDIPAPEQEGVHTIDIRVVTADTRVGHSETFQIVATDDDDELRPDPDDPDGDDGDGDEFVYIPDLPGGGSGSFGFVAGVGAVFVLLILLLAIQN